MLKLVFYSHKSDNATEKIKHVLTTVNLYKIYIIIYFLQQWYCLVFLQIL